MVAILARQLWRDGAMCADQLVHMDATSIRAIQPFRKQPYDQEVALVAPALTDLQVNGSGGVMLNSNPDISAIRHIVATQRARGTGWVMPTLITCEAAKMHRAADAALAAQGLPGFVGLHLEGPHLNPSRRGTHSADHIRAFDRDTLDIVAKLRARDLPVKVTLAPECVAGDDIRTLVKLGAVVSAGHSAASAEQARTGFALGIGCVTHLYNAMPQMGSRAPGLLAAAILSDAYSGIIIDGHHVAWDMVALACRARPKDRMFMVSDAMATIGGPDQFELYGEQILVRDGALVNAQGALAGAHVDLVTCLRNAVVNVGLDLHDAYQMAAITPRDVMGLDHPQIAPGTPLEEVLILDADLHRCDPDRFL
ncbi:N-acetylglucosamine-6-phosphate deacetylase [Thioclava sp. SK-1]|nr:N-acetylglucosamine-6-phosphate deacetylase [Thioclava sp. SK-1]